MEVLLLELLYKTDYSNDFDREVRIPSASLTYDLLWSGAHVGLCVHPHPGWASLQGVILCFGLCARGQVKTVLNVLHDFEERIQESEQSWQIGAWRVRLLAVRLGDRLRRQCSRGKKWRSRREHLG